MKILITGSNGYIGTNFYKRYKDQIEFKFCDIDTLLSPAQILEIEDIEDCDAIIHLAALSGISACENNHIFAVVDNILTAQNVFKLAFKKSIPVVFSSSQAAKDPSSSIYASMKFTCEQMAKYYRSFESNIYILRFANVYGGYGYLEKKQTCVKQFITNYKKGLPFEVHGDGTQGRDFVHVWDVCESIYRILMNTPYCNIPIDVGTGKETSIIDLANMFPDRKINFINSRNAGTDSSVADTSILNSIINFVPQRKLEDYINGGK